MLRTGTVGSKVFTVKPRISLAVKSLTLLTQSAYSDERVSAAQVHLLVCSII